MNRYLLSAGIASLGVISFLGMRSVLSDDAEPARPSDDPPAPLVVDAPPTMLESIEKAWDNMPKRSQDLLCAGWVANAPHNGTEDIVIHMNRVCL